MIALSYLTAIRFSGPDAADFLHNQLSADVLSVNAHESTYACYCEPRGRVLALMLVGKDKDDYIVVLSSDLANSISERLRIYVMRSKVDITCLEENTIMGLANGDSPNLAGSLIFTMPVPGSDTWLAISNAGSAPEIDISLSDSWKASELKRGVSWLSSKSSGEFLPQMLGFDEIGAVNYRKGCYPGQEIVARTHYLGKVKRHPRVLNTESRIQLEPLKKVQLLADDQQYDAIVVDTGFSQSQGGLTFVITRLATESVIEGIEVNGNQVALR